MKISIIGSKGRLGSVFTKILKNSDNQIIECESEECDFEAIKNSEISILSVNIKESKRILEKYADFKLLIECSGVKSSFIKFRGKIISIHPLFGPNSYKIRNDIIYIEDLSTKDGLGIVRSIFKGFNIIPMSYLEHDRLMAIAQALPYFISLSIKLPNIALPLGSFQLLEALAHLRIAENEDIMRDAIMENPFSKDSIERFMSEAINLYQSYFGKEK